MTLQCRDMATFDCRYRTFYFRVMPFKLMNAPATFERIIDSILSDIGNFRVYVDVFVISLREVEDHVCQITSVLQIVATHGLKLKISKCSFAQPRTALLRHCVSKEAFFVGYTKIESIIQPPEPETTTKLRSSLGVAGYYRLYIRNF